VNSEPAPTRGAVALPAREPAPSKLGLVRLLGAHYYVHDLERSRRFYVEQLDLPELGCSGQGLEHLGRQRSLVFLAGQCQLVCSTPSGSGGRAARYLAKHPDGIGTLIFEVADIQHTFRELERLGGTAIEEVQNLSDADGVVSTFSITTPFGDTTFRFVERHSYRGLFPGIVRYPTPQGGSNRFGLDGFDHVTSNFQTMKPALLWLEHVLGFRDLWHVQFHTTDVASHEHEGSGLRSVVMWEPASGIKFANNEPQRPFFKRSQVNVFNEEHRGDGVQHIALATRDLLAAVRGLRARGVEFMPTPGAYYERLPERLKALGIAKLDEDISELRELGILVDGNPGGYLLQIFLRESAAVHGSAEAGPFFYELIQRKGDQGFGAGNFRALFESIEREQSS
jgi:4-hydroxyphenylpyruvate dioxygenase